MKTPPGFTGADALLATAAAAGIEVCFANPGTTEIPLVAAFARQRAIRPVPCVFEGVCSGAADGYGRVAGKPAMTLTHLGPGFANAIANLHNARRGRSPVVNVIGEHATWHLPFDAPLCADIGSLARPVSAYVGTIDSPAAVSAKTRDAIAAARVPPGQVATLIFPVDFQQAPASAKLEAPFPVPAASIPDAARIDVVAARMRRSPTALLVLGGSGLTTRGQRAAQRLAAHCGARLVSETFPSTSDRGGGLPSVLRLPYFPEPAIALVAAHDPVVLAGALEPVTFFGYAGIPSCIARTGTTLMLARPEEDAAGALETLADALGAPAVPNGGRVEAPPAPRPEAPLTPDGVMAALVPRIAEHSVVVVEGGTLGYPYFASAAAARRHRAICLSGGAIGFAPPAALGAALADPGRPVLALTGDGAALYTAQALWSMAREGLPVVLCIAANRTYNVVRTELTRAGTAVTGHAATLTSLENPPVDWVSLARGYGVAGERTPTFQTLCAAVDRALASRAPHLIELTL
ncbi:MAG: acetolactate synthase large subunit [candidate division NC10 bacterium]|nr:acetolactate synthase large subunit [candidate division NC10 bacterium]